MNGVGVILILALGVAPLFLGIVYFDRWLDRREQHALTKEADRYARAVARLTEIHNTNPGHTRIGRRGGDA